MGLYIANQVVRDHDGDIAVACHDGLVLFTVTLPRGLPAPHCRPCCGRRTEAVRCTPPPLPPTPATWPRKACASRSWQIFPVLRHEALAPLATAMLRQAPEGAEADALRQRTQRLAGGLRHMLEDSVDVLRGLNQWLVDNGASLPAAPLKECRKLLFSQLMWSKRRVRWPDEPAPAAPALFDPRNIENLALASGWRQERQPQCWSLHLTAATAKDPA